MINSLKILSKTSKFRILTTQQKKVTARRNYALRNTKFRILIPLFVENIIVQRTKGLIFITIS